MPRQPRRFGPPPKPPEAWRRREGTVDRRVRGRAGMKLRAQVRREEPLCRHCLENGRTAATAEVDHIVPLSEGGTDRRSNLQGLCVPCHETKSAAERAAARSPAVE